MKAPKEISQIHLKRRQKEGNFEFNSLLQLNWYRLTDYKAHGTITEKEK